LKLHYQTVTQTVTLAATSMDDQHLKPVDADLVQPSSMTQRRMISKTRQAGLTRAFEAKGTTLRMRKPICWEAKGRTWALHADGALMTTMTSWLGLAMAEEAKPI
jgi:hypothetical protein